LSRPRLGGRKGVVIETEKRKRSPERYFVEKEGEGRTLPDSAEGKYLA